MENPKVILAHATAYCDEQWGIAENDPENRLTPEQRKQESQIWQTAASILDSLAQASELPQP